VTSADPDSVSILYGPGLLTSDNGGKTWQAITLSASPLGYPTSMTLRGVHGWLLGSGELYTTKDAGVVWTATPLLSNPPGS
jgi:photosystem II stability/assembly factor-like uncharacterized protein